MVTISSNKMELVHAHQATLAYLEEHCCTLWKPYFLLPNSPDHNLCDYSIWGILEAKIWRHNQFQIITLEDLKERIVEEWDALPEDFVYRAMNSFIKLSRMVAI